MKTRPEADFSSPLCQPYEVRQGEHGVLLMHGFAGSAAHMRPLAEGLVQQGFGVRTINLPGHATTLEDMRRCSWQDWLNAAKEVFREMKEQYRFVSVTGLSMGGCLTLMIAEQSDPTAIAPISAPMGVQNRWFPLARFAAPFFAGNQLAGAQGRRARSRLRLGVYRISDEKRGGFAPHYPRGPQ